MEPYQAEFLEKIDHDKLVVILFDTDTIDIWEAHTWIKAAHVVRSRLYSFDMEDVEIINNVLKYNNEEVFVFTWMIPENFLNDLLIWDEIITRDSRYELTPEVDFSLFKLNPGEIVMYEDLYPRGHNNIRDYFIGAPEEILEDFPFSLLSHKEDIIAVTDGKLFFENEEQAQQVWDLWRQNLDEEEE